MSSPLPEQIRHLIVTGLGCATPSNFDDETPLFDGGLGLDSFAVVELIGLVETHFAIEFQSADIRSEHFSDISSLARLVEGYLR